MDRANPGALGKAHGAPQALPERPDGCGVGIHRPAVAQACPSRTASRHRSARSTQRPALSGALGLRVAHAADPLPALADGRLVVPSPDTQLSVPGHP